MECWNKKVEIDSFAHNFADWSYDWLDVPSMPRGAKEAFEYPIIGGGVFDDIDDVIPAAERDAFMSRYKTAAGFTMEKLNTAPPIIAPGSRVR